jgi:hypothetical protein
MSLVRRRTSLLVKQHFPLFLFLYNVQ